MPGNGRAWELVTAGPTNGVNLFGTRAWSDDGTRVVYVSGGPMPGAPSGDFQAVGLATRGPGGWVKQPIGEAFSEPSLDFGTSEPLAVDGAFSSWVWRSDQPLLPDAPPAPQDAFYRRAPDGTLTLLGPIGSVHDTQLVVASADAQHVVFQSTAHLLPSDARRVAGSAAAYEFAGASLRPVGVNAAGAPVSTCGSLVGDGDPQDDTLTHPVSLDGERIWFSASPGVCGRPTRVYLRENGTRTVEASASACTRSDCSTPRDVQFVGATPDGSSAFLMTAQQLTNDDVDDDGFDLYRYDVADHALTRVSAGPPGVSANVLGSVVASSDDGSRVYFLASGALVPGQGVAGHLNLYLNDDEVLRFVATANDLNLRNVEVSADGRVLAFATSAPLLPSDTDSQIDVYRYDAQLGSLQQLSFGEGGAGNGPFDVTFGMPNGEDPLQRGGMRYMSADGSRILFVTSEQLLPEDVNATPDVYEWADGRLGLVSSGTGDATVTYQGLSADGSSAFFSTDESLVPADQNEGDEDLYVARLGGGFPGAPPAPAPCAGEACQGSLGPRLLRPSLPTLADVEPPPAGVRIQPLGRRARALLAARGRAIVAVDVLRPGRVSLLGQARVSRGRPVVVARDAAEARVAGRVRLHVRLDASARMVLRSGRSLLLTLIVREGDQAATQRLRLRAARKR
ncbi:MAG TPA: hypothetical protein VN635_12780 [Conexibacter sp.]|nr:hypothetical protein [Conexibacter sp.]